MILELSACYDCGVWIPPSFWVFAVILLLGFLIARKKGGLFGLFIQIHIAVMVVTFSIATTPLSYFTMFSPLLSYPLYSCWIKPVNVIAWRAAGIITTFLAILSSQLVMHIFTFNVQLLWLMLLAPFVVLLPLSIVSHLDWRRRK